MHCANYTQILIIILSILDSRMLMCLLLSRFSLSLSPLVSVLVPSFFLVVLLLNGVVHLRRLILYVSALYVPLISSSSSSSSFSSLTFSTGDDGGMSCGLQLLLRLSLLPLLVSSLSLSCSANGSDDGGDVVVGPSLVSSEHDISRLCMRKDVEERDRTLLVHHRPLLPPAVLCRL